MGPRLCMCVYSVPVSHTPVNRAIWIRRCHRSPTESDTRAIKQQQFRWPWVFLKVVHSLYCNPFHVGFVYNTMGVTQRVARVPRRYKNDREITHQWVWTWWGSVKRWAEWHRGPHTTTTARSPLYKRPDTNNTFFTNTRRDYCYKCVVYHCSRSHNEHRTVNDHSELYTPDIRCVDTRHFQWSHAPATRRPKIQDWEMTDKVSCEAVRPHVWSEIKCCKKLAEVQQNAHEVLRWACVLLLQPITSRRALVWCDLLRHAWRHSCESENN